MLGKGFESLDQIKARDRETLLKVLTPEEVARVLSEVPLLRYRVRLLLIYACGLRVRECVFDSQHTGRATVCSSAMARAAKTATRF